MSDEALDAYEAMQQQVMQAIREKADSDAIKLGAQANTIQDQLQTLMHKCGDGETSGHLQRAMEAAKSAEAKESSTVGGVPLRHLAELRRVLPAAASLHQTTTHQTTVEG